MSKLYEEGRKYLDSKNYDKALEIYAKGESEGDVYCSFGLAQCLINGWGVEKDENRANENFARVFPKLEKLAKKGDALAQDRVALCFANGYFVKKSEKEEKACVHGRSLAKL